MGYLLSWLTLSKSATDRWLNASEILLLVAGLILTWGAVGEYLQEHDKLDRLPRWMRWPKLIFILMVVGGLLGEFIGDGGVFFFSYHLQSIEDAELERLGAHADTLEQRLRVVGDTSSAAGAVAGRALDNSGKAVSSSTTALGVAREARREADSFEKDIISAKTQSAEANSHLAEALKEAKDARVALDQYKAPRTLTDAQLRTMKQAAEAFRKTPYELGVNAGQEAIDFLRIIDRVLRDAGWQYKD
jgi:hypothetical protein